MDGAEQKKIRAVEIKDGRLVTVEGLLETLRGGHATSVSGSRSSPHTPPQHVRGAEISIGKSIATNYSTYFSTEDIIARTADRSPDSATTPVESQTKGGRQTGKTPTGDLV